MIGSTSSPSVPGVTAAWQEADSQRFLALGAIYTPRRNEIQDAILDLIPATPSDNFTGVELGIGQGWLTDAILRRFPHARMIVLMGRQRCWQPRGMRWPHMATVWNCASSIWPIVPGGRPCRRSFAAS